MQTGGMYSDDQLTKISECVVQLNSLLDLVRSFAQQAACRARVVCGREGRGEP